MACILQPECNFLHGFFGCHLPVEMVDVEVKITFMQGTHTFRRDRMCQITRCNPRSTRHCPHPTIIKKMRTYLELEWKLGPKSQPQQNQSRPAQPNTNCKGAECWGHLPRGWLLSTLSCRQLRFSLCSGIVTTRH